MTQIITEQSVACNNYLPSLDVCAPNDGYNDSPLPRPLTDLEERVLAFYANEWDDIHGFSDRTLPELALILKRCPTRVSEAASFLTKVGYLDRKRAVGKGGKRRYNTCITPDGYSYSVNKPRSQMQNQNVVIPYIDLSKAKGIDVFNLREEEACGQVLEDHNLEIDPKIDVFLMQQQIPYGQRDDIKQELKASRIGPVRIEKVMTRMLKAHKKKPIQQKWEYIRKCIETEKEEINSIIGLLKQNNLLSHFHQYAT